MSQTQFKIGQVEGHKNIQGRLSLTSGVPVTISNVIAAPTIYFTPYKGNICSVYNTTTNKWDDFELAETSIAVPATTNTPFDIFVKDTNGTLDTVNWTNDATRATALTLQNGVKVLTGYPNYRWLGTGRTTGVSGQCEDSTSNRFLQNYYNQVGRPLEKYYNGAHIYATATWRYFNNVSTNRLDFIVGVVEKPLVFSITGMIEDGSGYLRIGLNTTSGTGASIRNKNSEFISAGGGANFNYPIQGLNYIAAVECGAAGTQYYDFYLVAIVQG